MKSLRNNLLFLMWLSFSCFGCAAKKCEVPLSELRFVEQARGKRFATKVVCEVQTRDGIRSSLKASLDMTIPASELELEGELLKLSGYLPLAYDYENGLLDLYSSRLLAYYSPELKRFIILRGQSGEDLHGVVSHELTHALQDQELNLLEFFSRKLSTDEIIAKSALLEGDANFVMRHFMGLPGCEEIQKRDPLELISVGSNTQLTNAGVPRALELLLTFPYAFGESFLCNAMQKNASGEASVVRQFYMKPPTTSHEIIHKEALPSSPGSVERSAARYVDHLGEFMLLVLLTEHLSSTDAVALSSQLLEDTALLSAGELKWNLKFRDAKAAARVAKTLEEIYKAREEKASRTVYQRGDTVNVTASRAE